MTTNPWAAHATRGAMLALVAATVLPGCDDEAQTCDPGCDGDLGDVAADAGSGSDATIDGRDAADGDDTDGSGAVDWDSVIEALAQPGPERVGYRQDEVVYTRSDNGEARTLRLALWYPAAEGGTAGAEYNGGLVEAPDVWLDAPSAARADMPVMVYSHGHLGFAEVSSFVCEHLASRGWVVAAPDHTGNTTSSFGQPRDTSIYYLRAEDTSAVLDWLDEPNALSDAGFDLDDVLMTGHSFGGYTTLSVLGAQFDIATLARRCYDDTDTSEFCSSMSPDREAIFAGGVADPRVDAGVLMAAGDFRLFGAEGVGAIALPVLEMVGELDAAVAAANDSDPLWAALETTTSWRFDLVGAPHNAFTTICSQPLGAAFECDPSSAAPAEWQRAARVLVTAFAEVTLRNNLALTPLLTGEVAVSELARAVGR